ncbi:putative ribonuclease H-like domain-containing protein [Tanacetum coccineum]
MRPFGCPVTILNTIDHLGKFNGKVDDGFFVGYSLNSKAFRVFNSRTRIVEENLHIRFSENRPNVVGTQSNGFAGTKASDNAGQARKETEPVKDYILLPLWTDDPPYSQDPKSSHDDGSKPSSDDGKKVNKDPRKDSECNNQEKEDNVNNTNTVNAAGTNKVNVVSGKTSIELLFDPNMSALEDYSIFDSSIDDEDDGAEADINNLDTTIQVSSIPTTRIHKDHPLDQEELKKVIHALKDPSWIKAMQEEHLQFKNKKDEMGIVIRNKVRLVAQGYTQEEGIDYDEVFAHFARIEAIRLFLAYASFKDFMVYQMDVKSVFLFGKIEEEVYVCQPLGFEDPDFPDRVYKFKKALYGLHQAPRAWYETFSTYLLDNGFQRGKIDKTLFIKRQKDEVYRRTFSLLRFTMMQKKDGIFISQDKYVEEILKKFGFTKVKTASTPMETQKPLLKDEDGEEVDVHMYRSMIGSLMYLTSSRLDIMFAVCACARYQVNPKVSHLHAVKRIFRYLKGQPKLGLWYPKDSPFDLVAYTDSDYARASLDRKSTTGGCQFLGCRLISWQCKKQTVVANSTTEAEYVAASSCCRQVKQRKVFKLMMEKLCDGIEVNAFNPKLKPRSKLSKKKRAGQRYDQDSAKWCCIQSSMLKHVIENGATLPKTTTVEGVVTVMPITTAEEKAQRRLEVKARSTLMMGAFQLNIYANGHVDYGVRRLLKTYRKDVTVNGLRLLVLIVLTEVLHLPQEGNFARSVELKKSRQTRTRIAQKEAEEGPNYALMAFSYDSEVIRQFKVVEEKSVKFISTIMGNPQMNLQGIKESNCSGMLKHMIMDMSYLTDYEEIDGGYVALKGTLQMRKVQENVHLNWMRLVHFKSFITGIENLVDHKVKVIRCDNGTEFKNREMNQFCEMKGILRQFSVARTPQQNRVVERRNRTLIEAARTMLADSKLPTTFWAEAVNTACYVQNRVLVVKPHNKTPYELFYGRTPTLSFMRPFGCLVTILNTIDHLGKFDGKADEGFFVGYSLNSKAFRVFNSRTRIVEENLHIRFSESTPNAVGSGPDWLFDIDALTRTMNYEPIVAGTQSNGFASDNAGQARKETEPVKDYILLPLWTADPPYSQDPKSSHDDGSKPSSDNGKKVDEDPRKESECNDQEKEDNVNSTNNVNAAGTNEVNAVGGKTSIELPFDPNMPALEDYSIFDFSRDDEDDGAVADMNNLDTTIQVSPIPTTRIHKDHPLDQVIGDLQSATQTRKMSKNLEEHGFCDMCEELLQFKLQEVWTLVDLPNRKRAIGSKWVFRNKKDKRGIMIRIKQMVVKGYAQEKGLLWRSLCLVDKELIEIRLFLAYASFKDFVVYQMDVKSAFLYGKIEEEVSQGCRHSQWKSKALLKDEDGEEVDGFYCKKQTVVANSTTEVEYVAASSCYLLSKAFDRKTNKIVKLMMKKLFRMELELCCNQSNASSKTTTWNEFSRTMASAIICLATNQKFNFSKFIFEGEGSEIPIDPHYTHTFIQPSTQPQKTQKPRKPKRKDTQVPQPSDPSENVADEAVYKELGDSLVRAATNVSSLEAEQNSGNITKTRSKATPNESSSLETTSGGGPRYQETMRDTIAQTMFENVSKHSNDSLLARGNTLRSDEDRLKLNELMELCTNLQNRVLDLEKTKTSQHNEIASLKRRVKKLEKKNRSRTHKLKRLYKVGLTARVESSDNEESLGKDASKQGRIDAIDADEEITLVNVQNVDEEMFDVNVLDGEEVFVAEQEVAIKDVSNVVSIAGDATTVSVATTTTATITTVNDITLAQALIEIKTTKPKEKGDKGKGILIEPVKPIKKKDLIRLDEEVALKLQAKFDEEERLASEKAKKEKEANIALIETWDDRQRLMLIINWLKDCKHKNKMSCLLKKRLHYFNNS